MDYLPTKASANYVIIFTRYHFGMFTEYRGNRQYQVAACGGYQTKAMLPSLFIAAIRFLKTTYIGNKGAVNYG